MFYADVDVNKQGLRAGEIINIRKAVFLHNKETVGDRFALFFLPLQRTIKNVPEYFQQGRTNASCEDECDVRITRLERILTVQHKTINLTFEANMNLH